MSGQDDLLLPCRCLRCRERSLRVEADAAALVQHLQCDGQRASSSRCSCIRRTPAHSDVWWRVMRGRLVAFDDNLMHVLKRGPVPTTPSAAPPPAHKCRRFNEK